jgi:hypothetical protein
VAHYQALTPIILALKYDGHSAHREEVTAGGQFAAFEKAMPKNNAVCVGTLPNRHGRSLVG